MTDTLSRALMPLNISPHSILVTTYENSNSSSSKALAKNERKTPQSYIGMAISSTLIDVYKNSALSWLRILNLYPIVLKFKTSLQELIQNDKSLRVCTNCYDIQFFPFILLDINDNFLLHRKNY